LRILYVLPFVARSDARHGGRAVIEVMKRTASSHEIGVLYLRPDGEPGIDASLEEASTWVREVVLPRGRDGTVGQTMRRVRRLVLLLGGLPLQVIDVDSREFRVALRQARDDFRPDVVQLELTVTGHYASRRQRVGAAPTVLVAHDVGAATAYEVRDASNGLERVVRTLDAAAWRRFERRALGRVDSVVTLTARDAEILRATDPRPSFTTIPLGCSPTTRPLDPVGTAKPLRILFVGGFGHPPNIDAAHRLASAIFPRIRERFADVELVLVGAAPPPDVEALAGASVRVVADVPTVEPYLDQAAVVVAPLRFGGGMRVKVLDALAAGKAIVASTRAVAGLDVVDGEHLRIADDDEELISAIAGLLAHADERRALAQGALRYVDGHAGVDAQVQAYDELYRSLVGKEPDR
jgi:glycosyltransferase involved in cell wall biosynthesis